MKKNNFMTLERKCLKNNLQPQDRRTREVAVITYNYQNRGDNKIETPQ